MAAGKWSYDGARMGSLVKAMFDKSYTEKNPFQGPKVEREPTPEERAEYSRLMWKRFGAAMELKFKGR